MLARLAANPRKEAKAIGRGKDKRIALSYVITFCPDKHNIRNVHMSVLQSYFLQTSMMAIIVMSEPAQKYVLSHVRPSRKIDYS